MVSPRRTPHSLEAMVEAITSRSPSEKMPPPLALAIPKLTTPARFPESVERSIRHTPSFEFRMPPPIADAWLSEIVESTTSSSFELKIPPPPPAGPNATSGVPDRFPFTVQATRVSRPPLKMPPPCSPPGACPSQTVRPSSWTTASEPNWKTRESPAAETVRPPASPEASMRSSLSINNSPVVSVIVRPETAFEIDHVSRNRHADRIAQATGSGVAGIGHGVRLGDNKPGSRHAKQAREAPATLPICRLRFQIQPPGITKRRHSDNFTSHTQSVFPS